MPRRELLAPLIAGTPAAPVVAAPLPPNGIFVYSSLCWGPEDRSGIEIVLHRGATGALAVLTRTEGSIMAPLLAYGPDVKIDDRTGHITMRFMDADLKQQYLLEGTVTDQQMELSGLFEGPKTIPRVMTFAAKLLPCRR